MTIACQFVRMVMAQKNISVKTYIIEVLSSTSLYNMMRFLKNLKFCQNIDIHEVSPLIKNLFHGDLPHANSIEHNK